MGMRLGLLLLRLRGVLLLRRLQYPLCLLLLLCYVLLRQPLDVAQLQLRQRRPLALLLLLPLR